jgi:predicted acyltransferase (DUF342 family)
MVEEELLEKELLSACETGDCERVRKLFEAGAKISIRDEVGVFGLFKLKIRHLVTLGWLQSAASCLFWWSYRSG